MTDTAQFPPASTMQVDLSWDPPARGGFLRKLVGAATGHDLDLIVSTHDASGGYLETVWHRQNTAHGTAIGFSGDNPDGNHPGPDEHATISLGELPDQVALISVTVSTVGHGPQLFLGNVPNVSLTVGPITVDLTDSAPGHTTVTPFLIVRNNQTNHWDLVRSVTENQPGEEPFLTTTRTVLHHLSNI